MTAASLKDICEFVLDGTHGSPERVETGIPVLSAQNVHRGVLNFESDRFTSLREYEAFKKRLDICEGDVLLTIVGTIGRVAIVSNSKPAVFQRSVAVLRPKPKLVSSKYLCYAMQSDSFREQLRRATNQSSQAGVYLGKLKEITVPLPPLDKQRRIAAILDQANALRSKRRAALTKLDGVAQFLFLEMFGDPKQNTASWPTVSIGSLISDVRGGASLEPEDFVVSGFPVLHKGAIKPNGAIVLDPKKKTFVSTDYANANSRSKVTRDFVAVTLRDLVPAGPTIGLAVDLNTAEFDEYLLAQGVYAFALDNKKVMPEYFVWLSNMPTFRNELRRYAVGSTQIHIRRPIYLDIDIPLPTLRLQCEFALRVNAAATLAQQYGKSLKMLEGLFGAPQHRAFRGEL